MKQVALIAARLDSLRLAGKGLAKSAAIYCYPFLTDRLKQGWELDQIVLVTTGGDCDEPPIKWAESQGIGEVVREVHDLLKRGYNAAQAVSADVNLPLKICGF